MGFHPAKPAQKPSPKYPRRRLEERNGRSLCRPRRCSSVTAPRRGCSLLNASWPAQISGRAIRAYLGDAFQPAYLFFSVTLLEIETRGLVVVFEEEDGFCLVETIHAKQLQPDVCSPHPNLPRQCPRSPHPDAVALALKRRRMHVVGHHVLQFRPRKFLLPIGDV